MEKTEDKFQKALEGKRVPILTIDHKWHRLVPAEAFTEEMKQLEKELNDLIKRQGKANTETKEIKKLKKRLMDEIVQCANTLEQGPDKATEQKIEDNKRLISECNEKIDGYQEELLDLPREIETVNRKLMLATMEYCYGQISENAKDIDEIAAWIAKIRIELKKNVIRKQEKEMKNFEIYSYMHDIFGADVIEIFDMKYNPETTHPIPKSEQAVVKRDSEAGKE